MTLYDYIASLTVDGNALVWNFKPLTNNQLEASTGRPYVRVSEMPENVWRSGYQGLDIMSQLVDVQIFQEATANGDMPDRTNAVQLYYDLDKLPANVNEGIYNQPIIAVHRELQKMPNYDDDTGGLFGMLRFRLLYPRSAG